MSNIPPVFSAIVLPPVESEFRLGESDNPRDMIEELEEMPQGVLSLLQQLRPQETLTLWSKLSLAQKADPQPVLAGIAKADGRLTDLSVETTIRAQVMDKLVLVPAQSEPGPVVARFLEQVMDRAADRPLTEQRPPPVGGLKPHGIIDEQPRVAANEAPKEAPKEQVTKPSQSIHVLAPPVTAAVAITRTDDSPKTSKTSMLPTRVPLPAGDLADKTVDAYLRLPFAKDNTVGYINVSKPAGEVSLQLNLSASHADISRHLLQHLDSAEPTWRLTDSHDSAEQQGRDSNQHADDETQEPDSQFKHEENRG